MYYRIEKDLHEAQRRLNSAMELIKERDLSDVLDARLREGDEFLWQDGRLDVVEDIWVNSEGTTKIMVSHEGGTETTDLRGFLKKVDDGELGRV